MNLHEKSVSEWVVTSSRELPNPARSCHTSFCCGVEFSVTKKETKVGEVMQSKQAKWKHEALRCS